MYGVLYLAYCDPPALSSVALLVEAEGAGMSDPGRIALVLGRSLHVPVDSADEVLYRTHDVSTTSGSNSVVECQLPKLKVAGSNPVSRSFALPCPP